MAASDLTAGTVMNGAASLLNDTARTVYTYAAQIPYLRIALQELREDFELNSIPVTENRSAVIQINSGVTEIIYNAVGTPTNPKLPDDMVEPKQLWERARGIDPYTPMSKVDFLPAYMEGVQIPQFLIYSWQDQKIKVLSANRNNDIKIDYVKELFQSIVDENSQINVVNAITALQFRTAGLCAEFIERNQTSADSLNAAAQLALNRAEGIGIKGKQSIVTRRRPFRSGHKRNRFVT